MDDGRSNIQTQGTRLITVAALFYLLSSGLDLDVRDERQSSYYFSVVQLT